MALVVGISYHTETLFAIYPTLCKTGFARLLIHYKAVTQEEDIVLYSSMTKLSQFLLMIMLQLLLYAS